MPWEIIENNSQILAIHAGLLPTNQILMFGGSEHNPSQNDNKPAGVDNSRLFNLDGSPIETIGSPSTDVFCAGHAFLADGRLLVGGGTEDWSGDHEGHGHGLNFMGERGCWIYHPRARRWVRVRDFSFEPGTSDGGGRWYPTLGTLANGDVLAVSGHPSQTDGRHNNDTPERYVVGSDAWVLLTTERLDQGNRDRYYPRFHLLPDGNVFFSSPLNGASRTWNPFTGQTIASLGSPGGGLYDSSWDFPAVLLPLLPAEGYKARILICGDTTAKKIDLSQTNPQWASTAARQGAAAGKQRRFSCAVLLPTGQVFVSGGIDGGTADASAVREGELYEPGIDWAAGQLTNADSWQSVEAATVVRNYHSTALLLPSGRVWTAGSSKNAAAGDPASVGEMRIEVYKPPYDNQANRPVIDTSPASVGYGQLFDVGCAQAAQIQRVAITRCGSVTHAFDADQRYVGLDFDTQGGSVLRITSPPNSRVAPPGYYLLWVIDSAGLPCQEAKFIRVCSQRISLITDRSTFSTHEVQALGTPALFSNALYVVLDGFLPHEVGNPPVTPTLTFTRPNGTPVPGMTAELNRVLYEDDTVPPDVAQRITFVFNIRFTSNQAFNEIPVADQFQNVSIQATHGANRAQGTLVLSKNPNPYMRDGEVHWLSTDLRVFKIRPGLTRAGVAMGADPVGFVQQLLTKFNTTPTDEDHPFFDITEDLEDSQLELSSHVNGQPVFNFAVAKVRYRAPAGINADDVRVFFRMFNVAATGLEYSSAVYARNGNGATAAPLLGLGGGEIVSIPFFAEAREADLRNQVDATNRKPLQGAGSGEVTVYFGCWLDFNQTTPRFPLMPQHNGDMGAFAGPLLSIQELVRNDHCCLVAEIHYPLDPIPNGATPGSHDNLSQRNLVIEESENPGSPATHTVQSTFELKPSKTPLFVPQAFGQPGAGAMLARAEMVAGPEHTKPRIEPDELLIRWNNLPRDSRVALYLPDVDLDQVVAAAAVRNGPAVLEAREDGTLHCKVGDVAYVPIPGPRALNIPGLISVELPPTVTNGQSFTISLHQVSGYPRRVIGSFQLTIPVKHAVAILPKETRRLAVLRHIGLAIPAGNRWRPIWDRLLTQVEDRVRGFGGDPGKIAPSSSGGEGPKEPGMPEDERDFESSSGKVVRIVYDCFGDFEGFVLNDCRTEQFFSSCRRGHERIVLNACRDDLRLTVWYRGDRPKDVVRLGISCC